jgi:hypothetical protein
MTGILVVARLRPSQLEGKQTAQDIEQQKPPVAETIFDREAEQPERPHVEDQMQPAAGQKHHGKQGQDIGRLDRAIAFANNFELERRDQRERRQKQLLLDWILCQLKEEYQAVRREERVADGRGIAVWHYVSGSASWPLMLLRLERREEFTHHVSHSVQLINKIENDGDPLVVDPEILQVFDQLRSREVDLREAAASVLARNEPACPKPMIQRFKIDPCLQDKFAAVHGYTSIACRGL